MFHWCWQRKSVLFVANPTALRSSWTHWRQMNLLIVEFTISPEWGEFFSSSTGYDPLMFAALFTASSRFLCLLQSAVFVSWCTTDFLFLTDWSSVMWCQLSPNAHICLCYCALNIQNICVVPVAKTCEPDLWLICCCSREQHKTSSLNTINACRIAFWPHWPPEPQWPDAIWNTRI